MLCRKSEEYLCEICAKPFKDITHLELHIAMVHEGRKDNQSDLSEKELVVGHKGKKASTENKDSDVSVANARTLWKNLLKPRADPKI